LASRRVTLSAEGTDTEVKSLIRSRMTSFAAPAVKVANFPVPLAVITPLWLIRPAAVTLRFPVIWETPRSKALASFTETSAPLNLAVAKSLLASFRVMFCPGALKLAMVPAVLAVTGPLWVIGPPALTLKLPLAVEAPRSRALTSLREMSEPTTLTVVKSFWPSFSVMVLFGALKEATLPAPLTLRLPLWLKGPPAVTVKLPVIVEAPKSRRLTSLTETSPPIKLAVAKSLLGSSRVMLLPGALKLATFPAPLAVIGPT